MLVLAREVHDLRHFRFSHLVRENATFPDSVLMPAPVNTTIRRLASIRSVNRSICRRTSPIAFAFLPGAVREPP